MRSLPNHLGCCIIFGILSISCLEASGDRGSAIGKKSALDTGSDEATDEEAAPTDVAFADFSTKLVENCSSASCHSTAGGIPPILLVETDLFAAINPVVDPDRLAGPVSLETMKGVGNPMPPGASNMQEIDAEFVTLFESWIDAKFDETGAPLPDEAEETAAPE